MTDSMVTSPNPTAPYTLPQPLYPQTSPEQTADQQSIEKNLQTTSEKNPSYNETTSLAFYQGQVKSRKEDVNQDKNRGHGGPGSIPQRPISHSNGN